MREVRFFLDENHFNAVASGLRNQDIDVLTTPEAGLMGEPDDVLLRFAAAQGRVLVTQDEDFLVLHSKGFPHAGIAYSKSQAKSVKALIAGLKLIHDVLTSEEMQNHVEFL